MLGNVLVFEQMRMKVGSRTVSKPNVVFIGELRLYLYVSASEKNNNDP